MKVAKIARNVILARVAWRYLKRRRVLARQRRMRRVIVPALIVGGVGAFWVVRRRLGAGPRRALEIGRGEMIHYPMRGEGTSPTSSARPSAP